MGRPKGPAAILPAAPAFTFGSRSPPRAELARAPGPGTYGVPRLSSSSNYLSSPGVGFGTGMRPAPGSDRAPAPGASYSPRDRLVRSASPQFTFKGVAAKDYKVRNPAPGHYEPRVEALSAHSTAPAITMAHRLQPPQSHSGHPAPNEYAPYRSSPYLDKGMPVTLKFRHERTLTRAEVAPGPGEGCKLHSSLGGPAHTIATKLKPSKAQEQAPGPAAYEVFDSTIGTAGKL